MDAKAERPVPTGRSDHRGLLAGAVALAVAVTLSACGPASTAPGTGGFDGATGGVGLAAPPTAARPADALAKWQAFPVTADPRPLILTSGAVINPATGFQTGDAKLAYMAGDFELAATPPAAPASSAGYAIISAKEAVGRLRAAGSKQPVTTRPLRRWSRPPSAPTVGRGSYRLGASNWTGPPIPSTCSPSTPSTCGARR